MSESRIQTIMEQVNAKREALVESWSHYTNTLPTNTPSWEKGNLASLLENQAKYFAQNNIVMNEDTTTANAAGFEKFIFPMIRSIMPNLVAQELVSVQVMDGPVSMLFYMDFVAGSNKGNVSKGDSLISARTGMNENAIKYANEQIELESLSGTVGAGKTATFSYAPVRPGTVTLTWTDPSGNSQTSYDNGNGGFSFVDTTNGLTVLTSLNYASGVLTYTVATFDVTNLSATYTYVSEGSDKVPVIDMELTSAPIASRPEKLRARWSAEVAAMVKSVHGIDAELELTEALAQQLRFGIDNGIIQDLWRIASAGSVSFDANPPAGVAWFNHQMSLKRVLQSGANKVFKATRRGFPNWIVCGVDAATILEQHPQFESAGNSYGPGVIFSGVFAGTWQVFKNPFLTGTGATDFKANNFLMGFKGQQFFDAGYVYAPWIPFFATPTIMLDDMVSRKAIMTHYAKKAISGLWYLQGSILNA